MNILTPYIGIKDYDGPKAIQHDYNEKIRHLNLEKDELMLQSFLNLFKNFSFRRKIINKYRENIEDLCCDIVMLNNIKQAYENFSNLSFLEIGEEDYHEAGNIYVYEKGYTAQFDTVENIVEEIYEECEGNCAFSDICTFGFTLPNGTFYNFVESEFEYTSDYSGKYSYTVPTKFYPVFLELEALINSNSEEFIKLIKENNKD